MKEGDKGLMAGISRVFPKPPLLFIGGVIEAIIGSVAVYMVRDVFRGVTTISFFLSEFLLMAIAAYFFFYYIDRFIKRLEQMRPMSRGTGQTYVSELASLRQKIMDSLSDEIAKGTSRVKRKGKGSLSEEALRSVSDIVDQIDFIHSVMNAPDDARRYMDRAVLGLGVSFVLSIIFALFTTSLPQNATYALSAFIAVLFVGLPILLLSAAQVAGSLGKRIRFADKLYSVPNIESAFRLWWK